MSAVYGLRHCAKLCAKESRRKCCCGVGLSWRSSCHAPPADGLIEAGAAVGVGAANTPASCLCWIERFGLSVRLK